MSQKGNEAMPQARFLCLSGELYLLLGWQQGWGIYDVKRFRVDLKSAEERSPPNLDLHSLTAAAEFCIQTNDPL